MTQIRTRPALLIALTALAVGICIAVAVTAGSGPNRAVAAATPVTTTTDTVSVSGTGSVEGVPDTLVASIRVHVRESSVQEALDDSATDARDVIASLKKSGVAGADIRTSDVSLNPDYGEHDEIVGYDSSESLTVGIHPLNHVGRILTAASSAAGNAVSIDGLSFDIADNARLLAAARHSAFENAEAAATQYATLSGRSLGQVVTIRSVVTGSPVPVEKGVYGNALSDHASAALPIQAGKQKVGVTVKVVWALS